MPHELITRPSRQVTPTTAGAVVPALIGDAGHRATRRFIEFFPRGWQADADRGVCQGSFFPRWGIDVCERVAKNTDALGRAGLLETRYRIVLVDN